MDTFLKWFMAVFMSVVLMCILALIASTAQAVDVPSVVQPPAKEVAETIAEALVIGIDKKPQLVVFISTKGQVLELGWKTCAEDDRCKAELKTLIENGKVDFVNIESSGLAT